MAYALPYVKYNTHENFESQLLKKSTLFVNNNGEAIFESGVGARIYSA